MTKLIRRLMADEGGASFTEYAILVSIVGAAVVVAGAVLAGGFNTMYTNLTNLMTGWVT
jgi:Flp pilus assembly pilin Flp